MEIFLMHDEQSPLLLTLGMDQSEVGMNVQAPGRISRLNQHSKVIFSIHYTTGLE